MADERIVIEIDADTGEVIKQFKKLSGKAKDSGKKTGKNFSKGFSSGASKALDGIKGKLISLGAVAAGVFATSVAIRAAADFEKIQTRLETLTGSAAAAGVVFDELKTLSASTPFQLGDIANASAKLISFGFSAGTVADQVKEIGEVAAGSGSELGELALIFGQVEAAGKLTGERLLQLQERAIPIGPAIAKSMGVAESSVRDLVKEGKVTADEFQKAFTSMTTDGGIFAGSLEKQSKTLAGVFSTLADNAKIFSSELGNALSPTLIEGANTFIKIFQEAGKAFQANAPVISDNLKKIGDALLITPAKFWLNFLAGDANANLKETNSEIERLENKLKAVNSAASQRNNRFASSIGIDDETRLNILDTEEKLRKLKATRDALVAAQPGGANEQETAAIKAELEAKAIARGEALKEAEREKARQVALENLGTTGLAKQEIIEQQLAKELEAIRLAEELKSIDQMGADERRKTVLNSANAQILALQKTAQKADAIVNKTAKSINDSMNKTLGNGVANGIETITKAVMQGENVFKAFGSMVLNMMADMAIQMGKIFVATGIAQLALFSSPGASILAGAALIAAGTVAKSIFGGGESASSPSGGGGIASGGFVASGIDEPSSIAQAEEREEPNTEVSVTIQGDVLDSDASGIRIVDIINNAFEKDGVVIKGASFA